MGKSLPKKLRVKWDALIETEGKKLGLENCRPFLENKMVNDIFYEGLFYGRPCIVKCSSKDPESIISEYEILRKLFRADPKYFPEPFFCFVTTDRKMAFIAMEKVSACQCINPETAVEDILAITNILNECGIVHRDIFSDNIFFTRSGHMKLIDFQFAVDRRKPHISKWLSRHWKYHFIVFARISKQPPTTWNDVSAFRRLISQKFAFTPNASKADAILKKKEDEAVFKLPFPSTKIPALMLYAASLWMQLLLCRVGDCHNLINKRLKIAKALINHTISMGISNKKKKVYKEERQQ